MPNATEGLSGKALVAVLNRGIKFGKPPATKPQPPGKVLPPSPTSAAATDLHRRGYAVIAAPAGQKGIRRDGWQHERWKREDLSRVFKPGSNIAGLMGEPSGDRLDVDLDCEEAVALADEFLPATGEVFGRTSRPRTHRVYRAKPGTLVTTTKYQVPGKGDDRMLVEIRSTGTYTILPGSRHPDGDAYRWDSGDEPAVIDGNELLSAVGRLAAAVLIVRHYPGAGARHELALALAGTLLRQEWAVGEVEHFIETVAAAANDSEIADRLAAVRSTAEKLSADEAVTGLSNLSEILGGDAVKLLRKWLGMKAVTVLNADCPYSETPAGIIWQKPTRDGTTPVLLTNFTARITADVSRDDGTEQQTDFEIQAALNGRQRTFTVPASRFASMSWATEQLGAEAIVFPGQSLHDHARVAVQLLSPRPIPRRTNYTHTGWRKNGENWMYLHAGGAIGAAGQIEGVSVELPLALALTVLPNPPEGEPLKAAIRASLGMLNLAADSIIFPLYAVPWRAVLGPCDFGAHLTGPSGAFKSEQAALAQQHFGFGLDARHLLGSWSSTDNALEGLLFTAKDMAVVVDDYAPQGGPHDIARWNSKADRIVRAQGNGSARARMRADGSLRPVKPPRCLMLSTGEDIPAGHSLRARLLIIEISKGDVAADVLTRCQRDARDGLYAQAMSSFTRWLAPRYEAVRQSLRLEIEKLRAEAVGCMSHCRTPEIVANLAIGLRYFLTFAQESGALSESEAQTLWKRGWVALLAAGAAQSEHQVANEPASRFRDLLTSAISSGRAHVAGPDGTAPSNAEAWGWRLMGRVSPADWVPCGDRVGWVDGEHVYLDPDASYRAAQTMAGSGDGLAVSARTLRKRLDERGWLIRGESDRLTVTRKLEGRDRDVLYLAKGILSGESGFSGVSGTNRVSDPASGGKTPIPDPENPPTSPTFGVQNRGANRIGGTENRDESRKPRIPRKPPVYTPTRRTKGGKQEGGQV